MSDYGDMQHEMREQSQKKKAIRRKSNSELVRLYEAEYNYTLKEHTEFHFSLFHPKVGRMDYWPSSGTAVWFDKRGRQGKHFKITDIEQYIFKHLNHK